MRAGVYSEHAATEKDEVRYLFGRTKYLKNKLGCTIRVVMKTALALLMILVGLTVLINVNNIERRLNQRYDRKSRKDKNWWVSKYFGKAGHFYLLYWNPIGGAAALLLMLGIFMLLELY